LDYIKEAEKRLLHYRDLEKSLKQLKRDISERILKSGPSELSAVSLDFTGISSGKVDDTCNMIYEINQLKECYFTTEKEVSKMDRLLADISKDPGCEQYGTLLKLWYVDKVGKEKIKDEMGYSSLQSVYDMKNKAIRKFAIRLFGINALKVT
jgi:hypothetical protein